MEAASTNSTSPPTPVTARPVATPGVAVRAATSWNTFWRPNARRTAAASITTGVAGGAVATVAAVLRSRVPISRSS